MFVDMLCSQQIICHCDFHEDFPQLQSQIFTQYKQKAVCNVSHTFLLLSWQKTQHLTGCAAASLQKLAGSMSHMQCNMCKAHKKTEKNILAARQGQHLVNAHLMSNAIMALLQGRPLPLPGNHTPKGPDHEQQLLPGHFPTQEEDQPLEQPLANGCIIIVLNSQGAPCNAVHHSLARLSCWTGLPTSRVYSNHGGCCCVDWLSSDTCRFTHSEVAKPCS